MKLKRYRPDAFSLAEVAVALGVAAFCLVAILGLLPIGIKTNQRSTSQTAATAILSSVIADLRATPITATASAQYQITFGTAKTLYFDGGCGCARDLTGSTNCSNGSSWTPALLVRYRLDVTFPANPAGANAATFAYLRVTWPAAIDPTTTTPGGSSETFAAISRN